MDQQKPSKPGLAARILDNLATAVLLFDARGRLSHANPAAEVLFHASQRHLLGLKPPQLFGANAEILDPLERSRETGQAFSKHEVTVTLPPHRQVTVDCTVTPLPDDPEAALLVELQRRDRHLRIARDEAQLAQQEAVRTLVRGLAHEVKNPLGGLRGAAQLLEQELPHEALREYTQVIIREADRLQVLVDRMLGPKTPPRREALNVHEVLEHVRQLVTAEAPPDILVERDYDPSLPEVRGDRGQLVQVFLNIARNAVQALGEAGRITLRTRAVRQFTIGTRRHRVVCLVQVIDNGPGIPPALADSLFLPMVTGRAEGMGLGLAIAQSLVSQQGGLIQCESGPGRTVFSVYLPMAETPREEPT